MVKFRIKEKRTEKNMTQEELAKKIGVHHVQVNRWENSKRVPTVEKLCDIANALELTVDELIEYREIQGKISDEYTKMINEKEDD